jgi:hypothetical protein
VWHIKGSHAVQYLQHDDNGVTHIEGAQSYDNASPLIGTEVIPCYSPPLSNQEKDEHLSCLIH